MGCSESKDNNLSSSRRGGGKNTAKGKGGSKRRKSKIDGDEGDGFLPVVGDDDDSADARGGGGQKKKRGKRGSSKLLGNSSKLGASGKLDASSGKNSKSSSRRNSIKNPLLAVAAPHQQQQEAAAAGTGTGTGGVSEQQVDPKFCNVKVDYRMDFPTVAVNPKTIGSGQSTGGVEWSYNSEIKLPLSPNIASVPSLPPPPPPSAGPITPLSLVPITPPVIPPVAAEGSYGGVGSKSTFGVLDSAGRPGQQRRQSGAGHSGTGHPLSSVVAEANPNSNSSAPSPIPQSGSSTTTAILQLPRVPQRPPPGASTAQLAGVAHSAAVAATNANDSLASNSLSGAPSAVSPVVSIENGVATTTIISRNEIDAKAERRKELEGSLGRAESGVGRLESDVGAGGRFSGLNGATTTGTTTTTTTTTGAPPTNAATGSGSSILGGAAGATVEEAATSSTPIKSIKAPPKRPKKPTAGRDREINTVSAQTARSSISSPASVVRSIQSHSSENNIKISAGGNHPVDSSRNIQDQGATVKQLLLGSNKNSNGGAGGAGGGGEGGGLNGGGGLGDPAASSPLLSPEEESANFDADTLALRMFDCPCIWTLVELSSQSQRLQWIEWGNLIDAAPDLVPKKKLWMRKWFDLLGCSQEEHYDKVLLSQPVIAAGLSVSGSDFLMPEDSTLTLRNLKQNEKNLRQMEARSRPAKRGDKSKHHSNKVDLLVSSNALNDALAADASVSDGDILSQVNFDDPRRVSWIGSSNPSLSRDPDLDSDNCTMSDFLELETERLQQEKRKMSRTH